MNIEEFLDYYGGNIRRAALAHGVTIDAVYKWRDAGVISHARQCQIEVETGYQLKSDFTLRRLSAPSSTEAKYE